jgi:monoamine oxidase
MAGLGLLATPATAKPVDFVPLSPQGGRSRKRILILGAGIAGLATAYEMSKAGYDCIILEARDRPGGRNWTVRRGTRELETNGYEQVCSFDKGEYMNAGPARIPQHHVTLDYCRELGVPIEVFTNANADAYFYYEGRGPLSDTPIRHRAAKADYFGYTSELLAKATDQGALDGDLSPDDKERLISYLRQFGSLGAGNSYTGTSRRGYLTPPGAGDQTGIPNSTPYDLSELLESRIGEYFDFEFGWDQAMLMYQPVGGMDRIPYALEQAVRKMGTKIVYGAEVEEILNRPDGVQVGFAKGSERARSITADYCVCTIPLQVLRNIPSNFSEDFQRALDVPIAVSTGKIGLQYGRRFWEEDDKIFGGITATNAGSPDYSLNTIWYPSSGYLGKKGVVVGYYNFGGTANNYADLTPAEREQRAVMEGMKIHGGSYSSELENSFSVSWITTRYSEGGWVGWPTSGGQRVDAYSRLNEPDGNVYLAGDGLSYYIAWQAGAFESARKVAMDIHQRVLTGS